MDNYERQYPPSKHPIVCSEQSPFVHIEQSLKNTSPPLTEDILYGANNPEVRDSSKILKGDAFIAYITELAKEFASQGLIIRYNGQPHQFNGTVYQPLDQASFFYHAFHAALCDGIQLLASQCNMLLNETIMRSKEFIGTPNEETLSLFRNCYVSNSDGQIITSPPQNYFPTIYIDANYQKDLQLYHPAADRFLDTISGGDPDLITRHWEFWGYCLSSDASAKVIFSLFGESGNNGKSTELAILSKLLSPGSVDHMNMRNLLSQFGRSRLSNLRLEISPDEGALNLSPNDIAILKSISGHDDMTADVKFKSQIRFRCTCKIIIASNHNIGMAYSAVDTAFARRLLTIPYPVSISREHQDPYMLEKLLAERDAIATEAFRHYLALRSRNYVFTGSERFDNPHVYYAPVNEKYNLIRDFSEQHCDFSNPEAFTYTEELYQAFIAAYEEEHFKDLTGFSQAFFKANAMKGITKDRRRTGSRNAWGFQGVTLCH